MSTTDEDPDDLVDEPDTGDGSADAAEAQREHLRGSSLMVAGRVIALTVNMAVQVLTVRHLGKTGYGVFAYGVSLSSLVATLAIFGQGKAMGRFLPRFLHAGEPDRARGAMAIAFATVIVLGTSLSSLVLGLHAVGIDISSDEQVVSTLLILISLSPFLALDSLFVSVFAVVAKPTAIFFRRHVLTPLFRLAAVIFVVATSGSVERLAWAYLVVGALGVCVYLAMLIQVLRSDPLGPGSGRTYPLREMWGFGSSMVASDSVHMIRTHLIVVFLEALRSVDDVGAFRAVVPVAQVNLVAMQAFELLYFPVVSRLFARNDARGVATLYWSSAAWLAVGTFPVFIFTFAFAEPVTTLLFGNEFADSATILSVLAVGFYVSASLGMNTLTLKATGNVRLFLLIDGVIAATALVSGLVFISLWGALGAALAVTMVTILQNVLTHLGLRRALDGLPFPATHRSVYASVVVVAGTLFLLQQAVGLSIVVAVPVGLVTAVGVLVAHRAVLDIGEILPEIRRIPLLRRLIR